jgi:hypothetical protein
MASGYTSKSVLLRNTAQVVGASATKTVVSSVFPITADDSTHFRADLTASVSSGTCSYMLQTSQDGTTWVDGKVISIAADGNIAINYLAEVAGDQTYLPLRPLGRFAVTTAGASGVTVDAIRVATKL